ncbi:tail fiber protein [Acidovorax sp. GBBC 3334]|uniref:phage tail protein n=1 Tax=unclassified Acidovorax TaxID=2684926 RepID=UPI002302EE82|nr:MULTISPECIES: tail fiber protein [unclassified Acidovorax]MDA8455485.1 tail fiber protein [Acidovorax sp. GBBC 3334]MDA8522599.1 tail fiber protein [Acidovorax sp. NCPPB 4044]
MEGYLGQVILWAVPFIPQGWALCDGTALSINQNQALYALLGTRFGGDGVNTFNLPDLRNRVPMGTTSVVQPPAVTGAATAQTNAVGAGAITIGANNLPALSGSAQIAIPANNAPTTANLTDTPSPTVVQAKGLGGNSPARVFTTDAGNTTLKPFAATVTVSAGPAQPLPVQVTVPVSVSTIQPSLQMNYIICVQGIFPSRA